MLKLYQPPKLKIEYSWSEPEVQQCQVCGNEYHDWQIVKLEGLPEMCLDCSYPKRSLRLRGFSIGFFYEYDNDHSGVSKLLCRQASQLAAAIQRLEDECKISL